jgi:hypothetical protein
MVPARGCNGCSRSRRCDLARLRPVLARLASVDARSYGLYTGRPLDLPALIPRA